MLKDEHQALQLAFTALEDKYLKAQEDNRELVERWMAQKAKDADVMNEENAKFTRYKFAKFLILRAVDCLRILTLNKFSINALSVQTVVILVDFGPSL